MRRFIRLRPAGLLAALGAVVAVACGTDYIELLPLSAGSSSVSGGFGGQEIGGRGGMPSVAGTAGNLTAGASSGSGGDTNEGGEGAMGGFAPSGGRGYGGFAGCAGFGCGGFGGSGGAPQGQCSENDLRWCAPCDDQLGCRAPYRCNERIQLCLPSCESAEQCRPARVCDPTFKTCGPCFSDEQCATQGRPDLRACELTSGRCVECNDRVPCADPEVCAVAQCVKMH